MVALGAGTQVPRQIKEDAMRLGVKAREIGEYDSVTTEWAAEACARWGLSLAGVCRRAFDDGPIAAFVAESARKITPAPSTTVTKTTASALT